jgi:catechol 2,3-dioxygenase-like lactoylglutathione lyase family enzyme
MPTTVNHIGLTVSDLDASASFYKLIGFGDGAVSHMPVRHRWLSEIVGLEAPDMELTFLTLDGLSLELVRYHRPQGTSRTPLNLYDAGSAHIAVAVDDIDAEYKRLRDAGVRFISRPVTIAEGEFAGVRAAYAYDPDGNCIELVSGLES